MNDIIINKIANLLHDINPNIEWEFLDYNDYIYLRLMLDDEVIDSGEARMIYDQSSIIIYLLIIFVNYIAASRIHPKYTNQRLSFRDLN